MLNSQTLCLVIFLNLFVLVNNLLLSCVLFSKVLFFNSFVYRFFELFNIDKHIL